MRNTVRELSTKENSLTDHDCKEMPVMKLSVYPYLAAKRPSRVVVGNKTVDPLSSPERSVSVSSSSEELNSSWTHVIDIHLNFIFKYEKNCY